MLSGDTFSVTAARGSAAPGPEPYHDVDVDDLHAFRRRRKVGHANRRFRNVEDPVLALDEELMVVGGIGVEIGLRTFNREDAQQPGLRELVQRVVDGRERNRHPGGQRFLMQLFGREMAVALREKQFGKRHTLSRRAEARTAYTL